jgi:hypothetical protein
MCFLVARGSLIANCFRGIGDEVEGDRPPSKRGGQHQEPIAQRLPVEQLADIGRLFRLRSRDRGWIADHKFRRFLEQAQQDGFEIHPCQEALHGFVVGDRSSRYLLRDRREPGGTRFQQRAHDRLRFADRTFVIK